jgi:hypothetical protein
MRLAIWHSTLHPVARGLVNVAATVIVLIATATLIVNTR